MPCAPEAPARLLEGTRAAIDESLDKLQAAMAEITMVPQNSVKLTEAKAIQMLKLMDALEDSDDVQKVYANFDIADEILRRIA